MGKSCKQNCFLHPYSDCEKYTNCETENKSTWKNMKNKDENISKDEILTGTSLSKMQKCNEDDVNNFYLDFFIPYFRKHFKVGQVFKKSGRVGKITAIFEPYYFIVRFSKGYNECFLITDVLKEGFYDNFKSTML